MLSGGRTAPKTTKLIAMHVHTDNMCMDTDVYVLVFHQLDCKLSVQLCTYCMELDTLVINDKCQLTVLTSKTKATEYFSTQFDIPQLQLTLTC